MIVGLSCVHLVEQGKPPLDSSQHAYEVYAEIRDAKVLIENDKLEERKEDITLRKLLSHTSRFGYEFFNPRLMEYGRRGGRETRIVGRDALQLMERRY